MLLTTDSLLQKEISKYKGGISPTKNIGMKKLILIKNENEIIGWYDKEVEANTEIRLDPKFKNFPNLKDQDTYRIKVLVPYIAKIKIEQVEGPSRSAEGSSILSINSVFESAGYGVAEGYNKCDVHVELSNGDKGRMRVDASMNDRPLFDQISSYMPDVWCGPVTGEGYVY